MNPVNPVYQALTGLASLPYGMTSEDQIDITDPEGIALVVGVALLYLGVRLVPRFLAGFRNFIPPAEVKRRIDARQKLLLVDVRSRREFAGDLGHVPGALNVPLAELAMRLEQDPEFSPDDETTVIAVCRSDARAAFAVRRFRSAGFKRILVMSVGMLGWLEAGVPVEHRHE